MPKNRFQRPGHRRNFHKAVYLHIIVDKQYYMSYNIVKQKGGLAMTFPLGAPLLDACMLAVLAEGDTYGYRLTKRMKEQVELSESTLYPVLRRLQQSGCLTVYDKPFQGRNRRYYAITPAGRALLTGYREEWVRYRSQIEGLLLGKKEDGHE